MIQHLPSSGVWAVPCAVVDLFPGNQVSAKKQSLLWWQRRISLFPLSLVNLSSKVVPTGEQGHWLPLDSVIGTGENDGDVM